MATKYAGQQANIDGLNGHASSGVCMTSAIANDSIPLHAATYIHVAVTGRK